MSTICDGWGIDRCSVRAEHFFILDFGRGQRYYKALCKFCRNRALILPGDKRVSEEEYITQKILSA